MLGSLADGAARVGWDRRRRVIARVRFRMGCIPLGGLRADYS